MPEHCVLGIDPGSQRTGFGLVAVAGAGFRHIDHGVIRIEQGLDLAERLQRVFCEVGQIVGRYQPAAAAFERVFFGKNANTALVLVQARAAAILAAATQHVPFYEYAPSEVKSSVVGRGRAEKHQVQQMIKILLGLDKPPAQDASDALAVAICHCQRMKFLRLLP